VSIFDGTSHAQRQAEAVKPSAAERMSEPGPETKQLAQRTGTWDVVATMWPSPGATAIVTKELIAERTMIGPFLQEIMRPASASKQADFRRIDYLSYDRVANGSGTEGLAVQYEYTRR
jgi:hypothetical protein